MNTMRFVAALGVMFAMASVEGEARSAPPAPTAAASDARETTVDLGNKVTMKLTLIPAGKFSMGSPKEEKDHMREEAPAHAVTLTKPFYLGVYPVTQEQYEGVIGRNPSFTKGPQNPVEQVSWDDAAAFCKKLSAMSGKTVRLPTEAEWEYACRAGTTTRFSFGDDERDLGDYAWYSRNSDKTTHPVGQKKPNAFGLYDMLGNVGNWCSDFFAGSYPSGDATDPKGPAASDLHVLRGGCWGHDANFCRCAFRVGGGRGGSLYGFRVVMEAGTNQAAAGTGGAVAELVDRGAVSPKALVESMATVLGKNFTAQSSLGYQAPANRAAAQEQVDRAVQLTAKAKSVSELVATKIGKMEAGMVNNMASGGVHSGNELILQNLMFEFAPGGKVNWDQVKITENGDAADVAFGTVAGNSLALVKVDGKWYLADDKSQKMPGMMSDAEGNKKMSASLLKLLDQLEQKVNSGAVTKKNFIDAYSNMINESMGAGAQ